LRALATDAKLNISAADRPVRKPRRLHGRARGIDNRHDTLLHLVRARASITTYTGFEFELHAKGDGVEPLVAGRAL